AHSMLTIVGQANSPSDFIMKLHLILLPLLLVSSAWAVDSAVEEAQWKKLAERANKANETGVCPVHEMKMTKTEVPIEYGLPAPPGPNQPTPLQRAQLFPFARKFVLGGCVPIDKETHTQIFVCSSCLTAEKQWLSS